MQYDSLTVTIFLLSLSVFVRHKFHCLVLDTTIIFSQFYAQYIQYTNIQQRMTEQNQVGDSDAKVRVVKGILDLLDNFDRASGVIVAETDVEHTIEAGYKQAYQDILDQFATMGVTEVETLGTEFDYELHQAVMQMPGTEYEEGVVCKEFQKGFIMDESLIRPAMVAVAL